MTFCGQLTDSFVDKREARRGERERERVADSVVGCQAGHKNVRVEGQLGLTESRRGKN